MVGIYNMGYDGYAGDVIPGMFVVFFLNPALQWRYDGGIEPVDIETVGIYCI